MAHSVLHVLAQRPGRTGSGVSIEAAVRCAATAGWEQHVIVGTPAGDPHPQVGGLPTACIHPLVFGRGDLDFPLPGMSDVMPYPSSRYGALNKRQLDAYRSAWRRHVSDVVRRFDPDVIHTRHIWLLSSMMKDIAPNVPVVNHCHATGLRQMELCPHLAGEVRRGCARNDRFCVLHEGHADALVDRLGVARSRVHVVGAGYRDDVFHARRVQPQTEAILYAGKYACAKGLPQLLDAVERLAEQRSALVLHVAGDGAGSEAEALRERMAGMRPRVVMHGAVDQPALARLMRECGVFVLPSFYEGLPLVLVEALACGCRLVCSDLSGVRRVFGPPFAPVLDRVPLPRLIGPDAPVPEDLPAFVDALTQRIDSALDRPPLGDPTLAMPGLLHPFRWEAVFQRIEAIWRELIER